jgi:hypothetical protein
MSIYQSEEDWGTVTEEIHDTVRYLELEKLVSSTDI